MSAPSVTSGRSGELAAERGIGDGGAQVGEAAEGLADLEQAGLGALVRGEGVELVVADRAHQDGVALERGVERGGGQRRAGGGDGDAADEQGHEGEVVAAELGDGAQDGDCFVGDFGADAVAGEDGYLKLHALSFIVVCCCDREGLDEVFNFVFSARSAFSLLSVVAMLVELVSRPYWRNNGIMMTIA
jgi:hypothetical protein